MSVTSLRLSILPPHYQEQLRDILASVGVLLPSRGNQPVTVKFFAGDQSRSRSATPTGRRRKSSVSRTRTDNVSSVSESELRAMRTIFPEINSFKFVTSWRPKKYLISKLIAVIDNVYSDFGEGTFGENLMRHFHDRLGLKSLVEFNVLDLLSNCVAQRTRCMDVDIFLRFLEGFYGAKDFEFFAFLKRSMTVEPGAVSLDDCDRICTRLFRNHPSLKQTVMDTIKEEVSKKIRDHKKIQSDFLIYISLWVFHHQDVPTRTTTSPNSSISDYVDSILMLKSQTQKQKQQPKNILRESVQMEEVVNQMLADCCVRETGDGGTVEAADALMQAVMTGDEKNWDELGGTGIEFTECLQARDNLLEVIGEGGNELQLEQVLFAFCGSIARTSVLKGERVSYRT